MPSSNYYPKLSNLVDLSQLPDELDFLHNGLTSFFDKFYFKNYVIKRSFDGVSTTINIDIISAKDLSYDIGGSGFVLRFNPDFTSPNSPTVFSISFELKWEILKYLKHFTNGNFTGTTQDFFDIFKEIISVDELIAIVIETIIGGDDPMQDFAVHLNTNYATSITVPLPTDLSLAFQSILSEVASNNLNVVNIIYTDYITNTDPLLEDNNLSKLLAKVFPVSPKETLKQLIKPNVYAGVNLGIGLEIPRNVLAPMKLVSGSTDTYEIDATLVMGNLIKTTLLFNAGTVYFKSGKGIGFEKELELTMSHAKAKIGKTPFNIGFTKAKFENYTNEDGKQSLIRIESAAIGFNVDSEGSGPDFSLFGRDLVIDSGRGFTGILGINTGGLLSHTFGNGLYLELTIFELRFLEDEVVGSMVNGIMRIPGFEVDGTPVDINVTLNFYTDGFEVIAEVPTPVTVLDSSIVEVKLSHVELGRRDAIWKLKFEGKLINNINIPFANKFIPKEFDIQNLSWTQGEGVDYSVGLIWENGLNILVSNEGPPQFTEFRKRFEITKKKEDGFFKLDAIELVIKPENPEGISAALEFYGAQFNIGDKVSFSINGLGLKVSLTEAPSGNGAIGPFDTSFEITGPKGIGVSIDAGAVKGTGYLYIDQDEFRGLVQLEISEKFSITAIAVLNTKMPDGEKGNSFITIISITGLNIQLGMGFVLDGLGGILGIHRTMDTQFLRDGIRNGTMDSLMFPANVQQNLSQIISDIKSVYPMKRDQFIFGPMAKLYWGGVKAIVFADLALLIEFSDPTRLIVLGKAVIGIVVGNFDLIIIQVGVLAELNFTEKKLMIDASIYNSKLLFFTLEGDMALRLYWGEGKAFLLTVGGFHPDYKPSDNMKVNNVRRMKISLLDDNPRLTVEAYFAVTSNTVQFGAAVDFYFGISGFAVKGGFGFDCLFQFNPFQFTVGVYAYLGIFKGNSELMGVSLSGSLKGTTPWSISGSVEFKVLCIKVKGRVDKTWGDNQNTSLPAVQVNDLVIAALNDDKSWQTSLPDQRYFLVGLSDNSKVAVNASGDPVLLMSPMSTLTIKQDVVPLDVTLNHYYNQKVSGSDKFAMNEVVIGTDAYSGSTLTKTKIDFAPAQYFTYSDSQKLSKSSFESMVNGVSLTGNGELIADHVVDMEYNYDMTLYDGQPASDPDWLWLNERSLDGVFTHDFLAVDEFVKGGFISNNAQSKANRYKSEKVEGNTVNVVNDFVIVNKNTFDAHNNDMATYSAADLSAAEDLVSQLLATDPDLEGELMVVQKHELV